METHHQHHNNHRENDVEKQQIEVAAAQLMQENKEHQAAKQQQQSSPPTTSPPSPSSSPSHEFSFTISHHSTSTTTFPTDKSKAPPPNSLAVDLSPADDIFFHGHLLPLQILSHFPSSSSPRSSTNSMDSFTLPIRELLLEDENLPTKDSGSSTTSTSTSTSNRSIITLDSSNNSSKRGSNNNIGTKAEGKSNSKLAFSLFGLTKGRKGCKVREKEDKEKHKKKLRLDVIHALKKYLRMVQPRMLFRGQREKIRLHRQSYSYAGNATPRNKQELRGWAGQYSAPASMKTSPSNSGLLFAATPLPPASDSTMEELQAAIQAAIAHCKSSFAKDEKLKS